MTRSLLLTTALFLGCGTAQYAAGPGEEVLTDGKPAPHQPTEAESSWCRPPPDFPKEIMLVVGDFCWIELDATQARCAEHKREEPYRYMLYQGRCWWLHGRKPKPQPTSRVFLRERP